MAVLLWNQDLKHRTSCSTQISLRHQSHEKNTNKSMKKLQGGRQTVFLAFRGNTWQESIRRTQLAAFSEVKNFDLFSCHRTKKHRLEFKLNLWMLVETAAQTPNFIKTPKIKLAVKRYSTDWLVGIPQCGRALPSAQPCTIWRAMSVYCFVPFMVTFSGVFVTQQEKNTPQFRILLPKLVPAWRGTINVSLKTVTVTQWVYMMRWTGL